jgi:hypothetical protein
VSDEPWVYEHHPDDRSRPWFADLLAWMRANGVPPEDVPCWSTLTAAEGYLRTEVYERDANGKVLVRGGEAARREQTFRLTTAPPHLSIDPPETT